MRNRDWIFLLWCMFWMTGCSDRPEECSGLHAISDAYPQNLSPLKPDLADPKLLAAVKQAGASIEQSAGQLKKLQLTDEKLLELKSSMDQVLTKTAAALKEMSDNAASAAKLAELKTQTTKQLNDAKAGIKAACDKKERRRRARNKKKKQCDPLDAQLKDLPADELNAATISAAVEGLQGLSVSNSDVKTAVDTLIGVLKNRKKIADLSTELEQKRKNAQAQLGAQKTQHTTLDNNLKTYCTK